MKPHRWISMCQGKNVWKQDKHYSAKNWKIFKQDIILNLKTDLSKVAALAVDQDYPALSAIIRPLISSAYYDRQVVLVIICALSEIFG